MSRLLLPLVLLVTLLGATAWAVVPLGVRLEPGPRALAGGKAGPFLVVFYTRSCLEPAEWERYWADLKGTKLPLLAVNPPEAGRAPLAPPAGVPLLSGEAALRLARSLKLRAYPTTLVVDGEDRVRDALEGPGITERVKFVIGFVMGGP